MTKITKINKVISEDDRISTLLSFIHTGEPVKIAISGRTGVLMDEAAYDELMETIRILQDNPAIVQSLNERECGMFVDERDIQGTLPPFTKSDIDSLLFGSVTESLIGVIPKSSKTLDDYRSERLSKYETSY